jgi:sterol desaturase/sphingolipid hydroxylase (fatty acid hydroxylase superfamily)
MTSAVYVVGYELSHLAYHLPERSFVYRLPFLRALREHHARHHHPELMQKSNFNVTIPFGDLLFGTLASADTLERVIARSRVSERAARRRR